MGGCLTPAIERCAFAGAFFSSAFSISISTYSAPRLLAAPLTVEFAPVLYVLVPIVPFAPILYSLFIGVKLCAFRMLVFPIFAAVCPASLTILRPLRAVVLNPSVATFRIAAFKKVLTRSSVVHRPPFHRKREEPYKRHYTDSNNEFH